MADTKSDTVNAIKTVKYGVYSYSIVISKVLHAKMHTDCSISVINN
jgi:hypothetical protein